MLKSFERERAGEGNFPWVNSLKSSLEEALQVIESYKNHPVRCKIFSSKYIEKINNAQTNIYNAVNATTISNAELAYQAKNVLDELSQELENLSEENKKFQKDLTYALDNNKKEILQGMAEMLGMSNRCQQ